MLFTLRNAFIQALQAKEVLELARQNLSYYDQVISINRDRYNAGDYNSKISDGSRQPELSRPERRASPIRPPPRIAILRSLMVGVYEGGDA